MSSHPDPPGELGAALAAAGGAIPFERFMALALYGADGFYSTVRAGRRGDFITSPEVGPLFGTVLARALRAEWERLGRPGEFTVVEAGAGPGTLARAVLAAAAEDATGRGLRGSPWLSRYVTVEVSPAQRELHPPEVEPLAELPTEPVPGVVIANELLDNLPFRLAVFDGAWREAFVVAGREGTWSEVLSASIEPRPAVLPAQAAHGSRAPLQGAARRWLAAAMATLSRGRVIAFDYCTARTAELAARPWREWLRTYRAHAPGVHPLRDPGLQDITAEVCLDQLPDADAFVTQAQFLRRWGIDELVAEGRAAWSRAAAAPNLAALAMRSRVGEAEALLDPAGLGAFGVVSWAVGERGERRPGRGE